jgi:hypothetical protein
MPTCLLKYVSSKLLLDKLELPVSQWCLDGPHGLKNVCDRARVSVCALKWTLLPPGGHFLPFSFKK